MPRKSDMTKKLEREADEARLEMSNIERQRATLDAQFEAARARYKFCRDLLDVAARKRKTAVTKEGAECDRLEASK